MRYRLFKHLICKSKEAGMMHHRHQANETERPCTLEFFLGRPFFLGVFCEESMLFRLRPRF